MTNIKISKVKDGICVLTFSLKGEKVNILKSEVLLEFSEHLKKIEKNKEIEILLIKSDKEKNFIAGADINEIKGLKTKADADKKVKLGQDIFNQLENLPCITIAYINGSCMGGGTELILACDFRVATNEAYTKIALPEVNLGIFPGFGGTQRLPRLIGLIKSLPLILTGKVVDGKKAYKLGLVDDYFPAGYEKNLLERFIGRIQNGEIAKIKKKREKRSIFEQFIPFQSLIFSKAKKSIIQKTKGLYPAPLAALKVVEKTHNLKNIQEGLDIERKEFCELIVGDVCKNLLALYFTMEDLKKENWGIEVAAKKIEKAGTLGAGIMGGGIAWAFSKINITVRMKDISLAAVSLGYQQVIKNYNILQKIRKLSKAEVINKTALVSHSLDYSGFKNRDIVVEAVVENIELKKTVFQELEKNVSQGTIIASNTSALSIEKMAKSLKNSERFVGMHFFNPVNRMPLVEIIPHKKTSPETIATVVNLAKKMGKTPIVVGDCAGFLVNRILLPYINEAFFLLEELGDLKSVKLIDEALLDFGMPMGPFALADSVGLDVGYKVAKELENSYGKRMKVSPLIDKIYNEKKLLGKKSNKGIYLYKGKKATLNNEISSLLNKGKSVEMTKEKIQNRLIGIMEKEAKLCLKEGIIKNKEYLNLAMIMGTGFPACKKLV